MKRDKVSLDICWLKDNSLEDSDDLPTPDVLAQEIADDLQTALEQFTAIMVNAQQTLSSKSHAVAGDDFRHRGTLPQERARRQDPATIPFHPCSCL